MNAMNVLQRTGIFVFMHARTCMHMFQVEASSLARRLARQESPVHNTFNGIVRILPCKARTSTQLRCF
jgi:hypothetical protein